VSGKPSSCVLPSVALCGCTSPVYSVLSTYGQINNLSETTDISTKSTRTDLTVPPAYQLLHPNVTNSMQKIPSWKIQRFLSHSSNWPHFMKPQVSSPCLQEIIICPYPEPDQFSPHHFNIIFPFTAWFSKCSLSLRFYNQAHTRFSPSVSFFRTAQYPYPWKDNNNETGNCENNTVKLLLQK